jgi:hypothetical protein
MCDMIDVNLEWDSERAQRRASKNFRHQAICTTPSLTKGLFLVFVEGVGAFTQTQVASQIVQAIKEAVAIPGPSLRTRKASRIERRFSNTRFCVVSCMIKAQSSVAETVKYALQLQQSGCEVNIALLLRCPFLFWNRVDRIRCVALWRRFYAFMHALVKHRQLLVQTGTWFVLSSKSRPACMECMFDKFDSTSLALNIRSAKNSQTCAECPCDCIWQHPLARRYRTLHVSHKYEHLACRLATKIENHKSSKGQPVHRLLIESHGLVPPLFLNH